VCRTLQKRAMKFLVQCVTIEIENEDDIQLSCGEQRDFCLGYYNELDPALDFEIDDIRKLYRYVCCSVHNRWSRKAALNVHKANEVRLLVTCKKCFSPGIYCQSIRTLILQEQFAILLFWK
jgi:hypothetical protein